MIRTSPNASTGHLRQFIAGLLALPLSVVPFVAYGSMTAEGRLVRDRVVVALRPPTLPNLSSATTMAIRRSAPRYSGGVMVLAYHGIGSSDGEGGFVISPRRFGEHLAALRAAGVQTVTASEVAEALSRQRPLPPNAVMISFDDGRTDAMLFADPLLAQAEMTATMFVITGAAAQPGVYYASWDALESYAKSGRWDLQSHTARSHFEQRVDHGGKLPALTSLGRGETIEGYRDRVRVDLTAAASAIAEHTGRRPVAFAYPFGAYGADRTNHPEIQRVLREEVARRYALAFHQDEQESVPLVQGDQDRLGLRRLEVEDWTGLELVRRIADAGRRSKGAAPPASLADTTTRVPKATLPFVGAPTPVVPVPTPDELPDPRQPTSRLPEVPDVTSRLEQCDGVKPPLAISIDKPTACIGSVAR